MRLNKSDFLALFLIALAGLSPFYLVFFQGWTFIGDTDRFNMFLSLKWFEISQIIKLGYVPAWNEQMFMGMNEMSHALLLRGFGLDSYIYAMFPQLDFYRVMGIVSIGYLVLCGICAYFFIKDCCDEIIPSLVGAILYMFSVYAIDLVTILDSALGILMYMPLAMLIVRRLSSKNVVLMFIALTLLNTALFLFTFLQEAGYALILIGSYAFYRSIVLRRFYPIVIFITSAIVMALLSAPRILTVYYEFVQLHRTHSLNVTQGIEILRFFNEGLLGRFQSESIMLGNQINLHEGLQMLGSTFGALAVVSIFFITISRLGKRLPLKDKDIVFHILFVIFVLVVILNEGAQHLFYLLCFKMDFFHARLSMAAILPLCVLISFFLKDLLVKEVDCDRRVLNIGIAMGFLAVLSLWCIEGPVFEDALHFVGWDRAITIFSYRTPSYEWIKTCVLAISFLVIMFFAVKKTSRMRTRCILGIVLAFLMIGESILYANMALAGSQTRNHEVPFLGNDFLNVPPGRLRTPARRAVLELHERIDVDQYRSIIIVDDEKFPAYGGVAPHVSAFWDLRLFEGYSSAVPLRLMFFNWPQIKGITRHLKFCTHYEIPWRLLAQFNVKYGINADLPFYYNSPYPGDETKLVFDVSKLKIMENPFPVLPRHFFTQKISLGTGITPDPQAHTLVEGIRESQVFSVKGDIDVQYSSDRIDIQVEASSDERFLVLNERFHPDWHAYSGGKELTLYPANVLMRGLKIPPGAHEIHMRFSPFIYSNSAQAIVFEGILFAFLALFFIRRWARSKEHT